MGRRGGGREFKIVPSFKWSLRRCLSWMLTFPFLVNSLVRVRARKTETSADLRATKDLV